jgi:two-component system invasion response regulator UvrY
MSRDLATIILEDKLQGTTNPFSYLSSRELEIALLLEKGISLPEICTTLNIQYSTGNTYKRRIFEKLHIDNILTLSKLIQSYNIQ